MSQALVEWYKNYEPFRGLQVFSTLFQGGASSFSFMPNHPAIYNYDIPTKGVNFYAAEKAKIATNYETGWRNHEYPEFGMIVGPANRVCECDFTKNDRPINVFVLSVDGNEASEMVSDFQALDRLDYGELHNVPVVDQWSNQAYLYMSEKVMQREHADPLFHEGIITAFVRNAFALAHAGKLKRRRAEKLAPKELALTLDYISVNYGSQLSLQELAGLSGYSKYHFLRAFSNSVGKTPYHYVLMERVKRAADLLRNSNVSISDIADITGFADQAHLTRQVHRFVGQTPARLRGEKIAQAASKEKVAELN